MDVTGNMGTGYMAARKTVKLPESLLFYGCRSAVITLDKCSMSV